MARRLINFSISVNIISTVPTRGLWFTVLPNAITIDGLRCSFSIERDLKKHPNSSTLQVYNLAPQTRHELQQSGLLIEILAGYDGDLRMIFRGDVLYSSSKREGADRVTKIQLGDGARAYNFARVNRSFPAGTTYRAIVTDIATAMNLAVPPVSGADLDQQIPAGVSIHGPAHAELSRILNKSKMEWSVQSGELVILRSNDIRPNEAPVISADNGMVGSPSYGNPDKKGKSPVLYVVGRGGKDFR